MKYDNSRNAFQSDKGKKSEQDCFRQENYDGQTQQQFSQKQRFRNVANVSLKSKHGPFNGVVLSNSRYSPF